MTLFTQNREDTGKTALQVTTPALSYRHWLALGLFLLFVIRFLPKGIGSLWMRGPTR